jgi:LTXXQ motif family protein
MSSKGIRPIVAGLMSGWLIVVGSAAGMAQAPPNPQRPPDVEASIASLRQRLQITPAQEAPFGTVANALRANARAEANASHQPAASASAVDELRAEIQYDEVELAGLKRLLPALEALYASLSPQQRQAADMAFRQGPGG